MLYVSRIPSHKELKRSYNGGWLKSWRRNLLARFRRFDSYGDFESFMNKADRIATLIQKNTHKKDIKMLDIGCNKGFLLHMGLEKGWDVHGVELVSELLIPFKNTHKEMKDKLFSQEFDSVYENFEKGSFDVITAIDVVEHFEDPRNSIKKVYDILKPGGIFVIQTPDSKCKIAIKNGTRWGALKPLEHLHLFNKDNFEKLANAIGFSEIKFFEAFEEADGNFVAVLKK